MREATRLDLFIWAVVMQVILLIYFEVTTLVNLYPWNDVEKYSKKEKVTEATSNGIIILIGIGLFLTKTPWLMILSAIIWFIFLVMQLFVWWMPYLTGKHLKQFPKELYHSHYQHTIKILPKIKNHIIPDAQHLVLQVLSLSTLLTIAMAIVV